MTDRPTLGALRRRAALERPPYRPLPALPSAPPRPTLGALRHPATGAPANPERLQALDWLRWSIAVDAERTISRLVFRGWDRDEAVGLYRATMAELVDDAVTFGAGWAELLPEHLLS